MIKPDADLILVAIHHLRSQMETTTTVHCKHIYGHQDTRKRDTPQIFSTDEQHHTDNTDDDLHASILHLGLDAHDTAHDTTDTNDSCTPQDSHTGPTATNTTNLMSIPIRQNIHSLSRSILNATGLHLKQPRLPLVNTTLTCPQQLLHPFPARKHSYKLERPVSHLRHTNI